MKPDSAKKWLRDSVCIRPASLDAQSIAADVYRRTCRTAFDAPGFCVVNLGPSLGSMTLRQLMVDLKRAMTVIHQSKWHKTLAFQSAMRFDQQETTRLHLDGGTDECFLMLGYEPSEVVSELEISDYAKCAYDLGLTPKEFMARHNPMFQPGCDLLQPYTTGLECFCHTDYQILCINNSSAPFSPQQENWQGTLHTATMVNPDESKQRIVNSMMIASVPAGTPDSVSESQLQDFITTAEVQKKRYDTP